MSVTESDLHIGAFVYFPRHSATECGDDTTAVVYVEQGRVVSFDFARACVALITFSPPPLVFVRLKEAFLSAEAAKEAARDHAQTLRLERGYTVRFASGLSGLGMNGIDRDYGVEVSHG